MSSLQFTINFEGTPTPQQIATQLRFQAGLLEGMKPKDASSIKNTSPDEAEEVKKIEDEIEEADFDEAEIEEESFEEEETPPKKTAAAKAPKIDAKMVNDACKAHAKKNGFENTKNLLMKKFKTSSVSKLKPEQFADVLKVMKV